MRHVLHLFQSIGMGIVLFGPSTALSAGGYHAGLYMSAGGCHADRYLSAGGYYAGRYMSAGGYHAGRYMSHIT